MVMGYGDRYGVRYLHDILPHLGDIAEEEEREDAGYGAEGACCYATA